MAIGSNSNPESATPYSKNGYSAYSLNYDFNHPNIISNEQEHTLLDLLNKYADLLWEEGSHKSNVISFIHELHSLLPVKAFSDFTADYLDHLIRALRKGGNSNATINRKMAALSKLLRKAAEMGDIRNVPAIRRQKEKAGRIRFLEHDEEERLFSALRARSELYYNFCLFLVDSGARFSEGTGLRWNDINNGRATFWITKSGRSRSVPLTARVRDAIARSKGRKGPFCDIDKHQFRTAWLAAKAEAGLGQEKEIVPHILRHTCASRLVRGGIDIRRVQMWLGHQTLQMTMRYAHLAEQDLDVCVPVLERQYQEARNA